jgi:ribonuclease HI
MNEYSAWFDGACEPVNPGGTATFGVVIKGEDGTVLLRDAGVVGSGKAMSNNVAEYAGVLRILKYLAPRPPGRVTIHGDSNLVVNQLNGKWRIKKGLYLTIAMETRELLAYLRGLGWQINFCWIPREQNEECDALSKKSCQVTDRPRFARRKRRGRQPDARDARMIGRTIKTTGINVLRGDPSRGSDWWVCRCSCGREFVAHGWGVRHGHARNCGSQEHEVLPIGHEIPVLDAAALACPA